MQKSLGQGQSDVSMITNLATSILWKRFEHDTTECVGLSVGTVMVLCSDLDVVWLFRSDDSVFFSWFAAIPVFAVGFVLVPRYLIKDPCHCFLPHGLITFFEQCEFVVRKGARGFLHGFAPRVGTRAERQTGNDGNLAVHGQNLFAIATLGWRALDNLGLAGPFVLQFGRQWNAFAGIAPALDGQVAIVGVRKEIEQIRCRGLGGYRNNIALVIEFSFEHQTLPIVGVLCVFGRALVLIDWKARSKNTTDSLLP